MEKVVEARDALERKLGELGKRGQLASLKLGVQAEEIAAEMSAKISGLGERLGAHGRDPRKK